MDLHLRYIGITEGDKAALRGMRPLVEQNLDAFVKRFYAHLLDFEGTRSFLAEDAMVRRLLVGQRNYILSLFDAKFDAEYYEFRRLIGQTHFRIGLDFRWYIGAYALYLDFFMPLFQEHYKAERATLAAVQRAFQKATLLDMSIVLEAYHEGDKAALEASRAQVMHQEKLAAVGLLASGLAHEIGNPLASIQAVCDNQLRKNVDPAIAEKFKRIRDQVVRITNIVRQLVGFARPQPAVWNPVNLHEALESALAIAKLSRSAKNVEVILELAADLPSPIGIADQLSQVFLNLFLNALDALPVDGGRLTVRSAKRPDGKIAIEVEDNGSGISESARPHLFTPFFTTKDVGKGTGLGLHICDGIVKRHGGSIEVRSQSGSGSVFIVVLAVLQQAPSEARPK